MSRHARLKTSFAIVAACLAALPLTALALAGGGGGGGGGSSAPSASANEYDPAVEYAKGIAAIKARDFKAAKVAFDRVLPFAAKDANTHFLAGLSRNGLSDWKGAKRLLEKAVKLDSNSIGAQRELGIAYAKLGDMPKANAVLTTLNARATQCAGTCPDAAEIKSALASLGVAMGIVTIGAVPEDTSLIFASAAQGDQLYLDAVGLINEGRYEAAIGQLKSAQLRFGPHPDVLTYLGFANRKLGRFDVAEGYYQSALAAAPKHRGATEYYGELMVERGDMAGAKMMLARLDAQCNFGCAEAEELRRWITAGRAPQS
jgi:tetratricopeptide (TPR) repeat protein